MSQTQPMIAKYENRLHGLPVNCSICRAIAGSMPTCKPLKQLAGFADNCMADKQLLGLQLISMKGKVAYRITPKYKVWDSGEKFATVGERKQTGKSLSRFVSFKINIYCRCL